MEVKTNIRTGVCLKVLKEYPDDFFDFIVTPPLKQIAGLNLN